MLFQLRKKDAHWQWQILSAKGTVVIVSKKYKLRAAAENAMNLVRRQAMYAPVQVIS